MSLSFLAGLSLYPFALRGREARKLPLPAEESRWVSNQNRWAAEASTKNGGLLAAALYTRLIGRDRDSFPLNYKLPENTYENQYIDTTPICRTMKNTMFKS
ncbi:hypothetical protein [Pseudomonas paraeruginosa]|uniref:hypothetical protein n=1 Tax=Pseudomonas paraeruginosa TaxID=2994495 RepID=UPI0030059BCA